MLDRRHAVEREQLGEQPHHHLAVFEHVRHARRHAQVVLQHVELALAGAHDVDAGDVRVDAAGHVEAGHLGAVLRIAEHLLGREQAGLEDLLVVVDVVEEGVERADALAQARGELAPLVRRQHPRDDVERDQPLVAVLLAVDREGDADAVEQAVGLGALLAQDVVRLAGEPVGVDG